MNMEEHTLKFIFGHHAEDMGGELCDAIQNHINNLKHRKRNAENLNSKLRYERSIKELRRFQKAMRLVHYNLEDALAELP